LPFFNKITLFTFILLTSLSWGKTGFITVNTLEEWQEVMAIAEQSDKPIFLTITNSKNLLKEVNTKEISKYLNQRFINVLTYPNSEFGVSISDMLNLYNYPTYSILNSKENILSVSQYPLSTSRLMEWIKQGESLNENFDGLLKAYETNNLSKQDWASFLTISYYNLGYSESLSDARKLTRLLLDEDLSNSTYWPFILNFGCSLNHPIFNTITKNKGLVENSEILFAWDVFYFNSYNLNLTFAITYLDTIKLLEIENQILPLNPDSIAYEKAHLDLYQQYYEDTEQWNFYVKETDAYLNSMPKDSSNLYVKEAKYLYEKYEQKSTDSIAFHFIEEGIKLKPTFELYYSKAQMLFNKGEITKCMDNCILAQELTSDKKKLKMSTKLYNKARLYVSSSL